ncbi:uncharacterized protein LOC124806315 isoform X2 [Hydra vulgaris]|uniref:uncharacterized protein LOC124806315 isoform X2 n=1 Tax=Hydra vulgaris TaxID=6087 RepID=UPI0032EA5BA2
MPHVIYFPDDGGSNTAECSGTSCDIEGGLSDNTLTDGEDCGIVDFSYHHESEEDTKDRMKITCPIRKKLCHETASNLEKNAKFMVKKYNKQKKFKVAVFKEGDHVSVAIPKSLRNFTDMLRLPCVVLHKSFGEYPTYKLVKSHGVLEKRFNATYLMPYSSIVKVKSDANVSLSEAVLNEITSKVVFCRCKKACQTKHCRCFENGIPCVSRCHKGKTKNCKNNNPHFSVQSETINEQKLLEFNRNNINEDEDSGNSQDVVAFKRDEVSNVKISNTTELSITFEEKDIFLDHFKKMPQNGDITHYLALDDAIKDARDFSFAYGDITRQNKMIDIHIDVGDKLVSLIISVYKHLKLNTVIALQQYAARKYNLNKMV